MHETAKRLLEIGQAKGLKDFCEIARKLDSSDQSATNWKKRGVPKQKMIDAALVFGANVAYLSDGVLPKFSSEQKPDNPVLMGEIKSQTKRQRITKEILALLERTDDFGLGCVLSEAKKAASDHAIKSKAA